jgi:hypothetical protein
MQTFEAEAAQTLAVPLLAEQAQASADQQAHRIRHLIHLDREYRRHPFSAVQTMPPAVPQDRR